MKYNIVEKVLDYKRGNENAILEVIEIFKPIINKYSRILDGEDTKQDLIIHLFKVLDKINLHNINFCKDKVIVSYIAKSIRNEYIRLAKIKSKKTINETELNLDLEIAYNGEESEFELLDTFKILTKKEAYVMKLIYINYLSVTEVAQYMRLSRQAVNQIKNRALKKMRSIYID